ncbi:hypothetical protein BLNAU_17511 [Blattamonas nauphoetae]|uniref:Uncharacterized protein n=1 Tax=Blattamonas nauphoetae TaxID=2049346 RepID=A0ABQ9XBE4_9EUKA|nr:hypothetical protein BLNAU_17511 [Blattamonas nauphoetae]
MVLAIYVLLFIALFRCIFVASDLNFQNGMHASDESLLGGRYASHTGISHSTFTNITDSSERTGEEDCWLKMTTIFGVDFIDVQHPTSGCITESQNGGSSHTSYSLFMRGTNRNKPHKKTTTMNFEIYEQHTVFYQRNQYMCNAGDIYTIASCLFREGTTLANGKAIIVQSFSTASVSNCFFTNNDNMGKEGGAIRSDGTLTLTGSSFLSNTAVKGGALSADGALLTLSNCSFINNRADAEGGAVSIWTSFDQSIFCLFSRNTAPYANDIIAWDNVNLQNVISTSLFSWGGMNDVMLQMTSLSTDERVTSEITSTDIVFIDPASTTDQCGDSSSRRCQSIRQVLELTSESNMALTITLAGGITILETGLVVAAGTNLNIHSDVKEGEGTRPTISELIPINSNLFYVDSASLSLHSLVIETLNTPHIIVAVSSSEVVVSNCLIDGKNKFVISKHALDIYQSTLTMADTTIQNINTVADGYINAVFLHETTATFTRCTFTSLSNPQNGGAIHAKLLATHQLTVEGCTFDGCSSTWGGGGIYVDLRESTLYDKTQQVVIGTNDGGSDTAACLTDSPCLSFAKAQETGRDDSFTLIIRSSSTWTVDNVVTKPVTIQSEDGNQPTLNLKNETASTDSNLKAYLQITANTRLATIKLVLFQGTSSVPFIAVTKSFVQFESISVETDTSTSPSILPFQSFLHVLDGAVSMYKVNFQMSAEFGQSTPILLTEGSLSVKSEEAISFAYDGSGGWITARRASEASSPPTVAIEQQTFKGSDSHKPSHGLWLKDVGSAHVKDCDFLSFQKGSESPIQDGSAIHAELSSSSHLILEFCSFESCSSKGCGGSVSVVVAGGELEISSSNFTSSSSEQNGGALFVDLSSLGAGSYKLTSLTFASSCTSSGLGEWVYLVGRSFSSLVKQENWAGTFVSLDPSADQNKLWGLDLAESESSPLRSVSLLKFLLDTPTPQPGSSVVVGLDGKDQSGCGGTEATMCRTVEWALKEAAGHVFTVAVASNGLLSSPIILSNSDVQIASDSGRLCPFVVSLENPPSTPTSMIRVERDSALALSFLSFSFSLPSSINSIIVSSSGVVNVDSCVVQKATLSQPFVVSSQSSHTISNTSFLSSTFQSSVFILSNCPSLSIEDTRIADNTHNSSFIAGHIPYRCFFHSSQISDQLPITPHLTFIIHILTINPNPAVRLCRVGVYLECDSREHHVLPLDEQPTSETGCSCDVDAEAASSFATKGFSVTPFPSLSRIVESHAKPILGRKPSDLLPFDQPISFLEVLMLPTQTQSNFSITLGTDQTFDGLMEEFRRCESEFKNGDETVPFKIAHSVFNILTSESSKMKERRSIGIRSGLLERFSERLSLDCPSTLSALLSSVIGVMVTSVSEGRQLVRSDLIPSLLALSSHADSSLSTPATHSLGLLCGGSLSSIEVEGVLSSGIVERLCTRIESESSEVDHLPTIVVLDRLCCGLKEVIETEKSKTTDQDTETKDDLFSRTRRCGFALSRIEKAVLTLGRALSSEQGQTRNEKIQTLQKEVGEIILRHFFSSIPTPSQKEIGEIGIDLAAVRREIEQEREKAKREMDKQIKQMETEMERLRQEREKEKREMESEREKEKESARIAEEKRKREFASKMREMEKMKKMNEELIEEGRQRKEEKKREEERKRVEEEERRRNVKEGAAAIEVFVRDKFTFAGNVFTKSVNDYSSLFSISFGPVIVRIT